MTEILAVVKEIRDALLRVERKIEQQRLKAQEVANLIHKLMSPQDGKKDNEQARRH
jgi:hypothetical protein